jgi:hypothetical protein
MPMCGSQRGQVQHVGIDLSPSPADARVCPFGLKRTTFTAAVCLLSVERYSALGGCGTISWPVTAACVEADAAGMLGWIIHSYAA